MHACIDCPNVSSYRKSALTQWVMGKNQVKVAWQVWIKHAVKLSSMCNKSLILGYPGNLRQW